MFAYHYIEQESWEEHYKPEIHPGADEEMKTEETRLIYYYVASKEDSFEIDFRNRVSGANTFL